MLPSFTMKAISRLLIAIVTAISTTSATPLAPRGYTYVSIPCAVAGYDVNTKAFWSGTNASYPECSAECFARPECESFSIGNEQCNLYNVPVVGNYNFVDNSPFNFWDTGCETDYVQCAAAGYQGDFDDYWWSNTGSLADCVAACESMSDICKSYSYGNGECSLYEYPVSGIINPVRDSPYLFYDHGCEVDVDVTATETATAAVTSTTTASVASKTPDLGVTGWGTY